MITHVLEDWISLRATNATTTFTQSEDAWLELGGFRDFTSWIQVMQASSAEISVRLQTSPTRDEQFFENVVTRNAVAANKVYVDPSRAKLVTGNGPVLSRFLRWSVVAVAPTSLWTIQFRIVLALNPVVPDFEMLCGGRRFANPGLSSPMGGMG